MNIQSSATPTAPGSDPERRSLILRGALTVFAERGFHGATMKRIAEAAGISPGLVYWYFRDKAELFRAVLTEIVDGFVRESGLENPASDEVPEVALRRIVAGYLRHFTSSPLPSLQLVAEIFRTPDLAAAFIEAGPGRGIRLLTGYLSAQQVLGKLPPFDPMLAAQLLVGMMASQLLMTKFLPFIGPHRDIETVAADIVSVFLDGIRGREPGRIP